MVTGDAALAVGDALTWNAHVGRQWGRVLEAPSELDLQMDLQLLAIALRGVVRAASFARQVAQDRGDSEGHTRLENAIRSFEDAVPNGKNVRDILEHFDDYRRGRGHLQRREEMGDLLEWIEEENGGPVLVLGATFRLVAKDAVSTASRLANEVAETLHGRRAPTSDDSG